MTSFYEILKIESTASQEDIKKSYQQLALEFHPDKSQQGNSAKFMEIDEAWKTLRDPDKRRKYDIELRQSEFNEKPIVHEVLRPSDFTYDATLQASTHPCRCGGTYVMPDPEQLLNEVDNFYIACDECSLVVELEKG